MTDKRNLRGLPPAEAVKRWADPGLYTAMMEYSEWSKDMSFGKGHPLADTYPSQNREYKIRLSKCEASLFDQLLDGKVLASGILSGAGGRRIIEPVFWDDPEIGYDLDWVASNGVVYDQVEFFDPADPPRNVKPLLVPLQPPHNPYFFTHDEGYRHVTAGGVIFALGDEQRKVVKFLHKRSLAKDPWKAMSEIQAAANVSASSMGDLFGSTDHWDRLLMSDERRYYRLRDRDGMVLASPSRKPKPPQA